jgi:hypothetical protein
VRIVSGLPVLFSFAPGVSKKNGHPYRNYELLKNHSHIFLFG